MTRLSRVLSILVVAVVAAVVVFLMTWDIPPPTATIERVIPDDSFPQ